MNTTRNGRGTYPPGSQASRFFEKTAPALHTIRRSTPDSEALASSDDDHDHPMSKSAHALQSGPNVGMPRPARRPSWLSEVQAGAQRKFSVGSSSSLQQSQPSTPAAEQASFNWGSGTTRPLGAAAAYPWNGGWTMAPPAAMPEGVTAGYSTSAIDDVQPLMSPTAEHDEFVDDTAPYHFNVSYTPVRKNVRSQSYSAGQQQPLDDKGNGIRGTRVAHRPSRPSMLGEGGNSRPGLGLVVEDEGDEVAADLNDQPASIIPRVGLARHEQMAPHGISNSSLLKQAAVENALSKQRHTHAVNNPLPIDTQNALLAQMALHNMRDASWDEGSNVLSPSHLGNDVPSANTSRLMHYVQQPTWSSNLGFGEIVQPSESRRASFADPRSGIAGVPRTRTMSSSLHSSEEASSLTGQELGHATSPDEIYQQQANLNPYAVPQTFSTPTPDLFIVAFKCARAGTFYVPPNTGLEIKVGDNVIVEGDRGVDLGTVTHAQVTLAEAKQLTQAAKDAHFKWLMMFSKTKQVQPGSSVGMVTAAPEEPPTAGANRSQSSNSKAEDRPKMIRSIATHHQIQQLREKEGAEAKAKRVAQVKVGEHQLEMEILDAEMQYDWKKLTFFFYSPKYVNFNNLVIDLFKIYKTRIWMDAITNGTSQAAQNEILGSAGPVVASSSQSAMPPTSIHDLVSSAGPKKTTTRPVRPEVDSYTETPPLAVPYPTAGPNQPPLHPSMQSSFAPSPAMPQQSYPSISQINTGYVGSPPLSASAYSPYDANQGEMAFQSQYGGYATNNPPQGTGGTQWGWKHMQSPTAMSGPGWNSTQQMHNQYHPHNMATQHPVAGAQRTRTTAAETEQLTAYLRNLALNAQR